MYRLNIICNLEYAISSLSKCFVAIPCFGLFPSNESDPKMLGFTPLLPYKNNFLWFVTNALVNLDVVYFIRRKISKINFPDFREFCPHLRKIFVLAKNLVRMNSQKAKKALYFIFFQKQE